MSTAREEEAKLHIYKRNMGLTKRGSHGNGGLTVSKVLVQQTDNFTMRDASQFVTLIIPVTHILQTKVRTEGSDLTIVCYVQATFALSAKIKPIFCSFPHGSTGIYHI